MGRLITADTGFECYRHVRIGGRAAAGGAAARRRTISPDRKIEYAVDTDEPMLGRPPAGDVE